MIRVTPILSMQGEIGQHPTRGPRPPRAAVPKAARRGYSPRMIRFVSPFRRPGLGSVTARRCGRAGAVLLLAAAAGGQTTLAPPDVPDGLEPEPVHVEPLGLTIHAPAGAVARAHRVDDRTSLTIVEGSTDPTWSLTVRPLVPSETSPQAATPKRFVDDIIGTFRAGEAPFTVLESRATAFAGLPGQLCYIRHAPTQGRAIVSGWLFLDRGEGEFLVLASQVLPDAFPRVRPLLEACYATIRVDRLTDVALSRKARLAAGQDMLAAFTPDRIRGVVGPERWYRYYRPGVGGAATELGYYSVAAREGPLGAIDPTRDPSRYNVSEKVLGLLVVVQGHYLEGTAGTTYDTQACYWMAWDQSEEAWSIRGTRRYRGRERSEAETGIRTPRSPGDPTGTVTVIASAADGATRDQQSWRTPEVYLSQALRWKLGELLPRELRLARTMSSYAFDSTAPRITISLRTDRWEPRTDGADGWVLTTRTRTDAPETVSFFDADGELVERRHPDGARTRRITLEELHRLWKSKGLPTGGSAR